MDKIFILLVQGGLLAPSVVNFITKDKEDSSDTPRFFSPFYRVQYNEVI